MKTVTIQINSDGSVVHLSLPKGAVAGEAIVVMSDEVEVRVAKAAPTNQPTSKLTKQPEVDLDGVLARLQKLKPKKRVTAVNSIKAMFQFTEPIDDAAASKILDSLQRSGSVTVDANDKLTFREK